MAEWRAFGRAKLLLSRFSQEMSTPASGAPSRMGIPARPRCASASQETSDGKRVNPLPCDPLSMDDTSAADGQMCPSYAVSPL